MGAKILHHVQCKSGGSKGERGFCGINSGPRHWDDPNDQYWIKKGIDDYNNGKISIVKGNDFRHFSRDIGLR